VRRRAVFQHRVFMIAACAAVVSLPMPVLALEARITHVRVAGPRVSAAVEIGDLLRDKFLKLVRDGRAVFLQLEAALWEDRRVFDRIVTTIPPATWRVDRDPAGAGVLLQDQHGGLVRHADIRQPLSLRIDLASAARVEDDAVYYVNATVTAATVDERDIDRAGRAIFGDEQSGAGGLGTVGRFVFRTLLRMGKYLESATTEVTSRRISGHEIKSGAF
jgi:hypothetical protein